MNKAGQKASGRARGGAGPVAAARIVKRVMSPALRRRGFAESEVIPSHTVVARKDLPAARLDAFKRAMLKLNEPGQRHLLQHVYNPDGYVETSHADYAGVESIAREYGFLKAIEKR